MVDVKSLFIKLYSRQNIDLIKDEKNINKKSKVILKIKNDPWISEEEDGN